ncbi:MAG: 3-hydroxyisobutyrate dehydrogenase [Nocardioidaceae bacterium]|nr:3-hydroxyisobutyrate dehydrogenase [Nocardioidaceae bacterium]
MSDLPTVALLGTGTMGAGMARNIAGAGIPLRVWNRTRTKAEPLAEAGAEVTDSPAEAVRGADVVLTMLFDADSVRAALEQARDGLQPGTVLLQQSTVGVEGTEELGSFAAELGLVYVDAPVLGTKKPAEDGALVVLASGPEDVHDRVDPVLEAVSTRVMWVGEAGQGTRLKLVANSWVLTVVEGIAEALSLAKALGLDPHLFLEAVKGGAMDAPYVQLKGNAMLDGEFSPTFGLDGAAKDAGLIVDAARAAGAGVEFVDVVRQHFARANEAGYGDKDLSATFLAH